MIVSFVDDIHQLPKIVDVLKKHDLDTIELYDDNTFKIGVKFFKDFIKTGEPTHFLGYDRTSANGQVVAILKNLKPVDCAIKGDKIELLMDQTPFYGESGGQVGGVDLVRVGLECVMACLERAQFDAGWLCRALHAPLLGSTAETTVPLTGSQEYGSKGQHISHQPELR